MQVNYSFDKDFDNLMKDLKKEYSEKIFDLDGISDKKLDRINFINSFFDVKNKATSDTSVDPNANVDDMNMIVYNTEKGKALDRIFSYYILWKNLKKEWGVKEANRIIEKQISGEIYINDADGIESALPYCFNYSTYDIMTKGLPMVNKVKCKPPKYLTSFKSQLEQFTVIASNSTKGATGLADMLVVMSYYVKNMLKNLKDAHFHFRSEDDVWLYVKEQLVSFIYTVNQPMRANQCVTEDTEVLTPSGFKKYNELKVGDKIYTWKDGRLNIQNVQKVNIHNYDGLMHRYSGRDTIQQVTPNHRVLYKENTKNTYKLKYSEDLFKMKTPLTYPVAMLEDDRKDYNISDNLLELLVFILTDGCIKKSDGKKDVIQIFKSPKKWGNKRIIELLEALKLKYTHQLKESTFGELNYYNISTDSSQHLIKLLEGTKKKLPNFFTQLSRRQANLVIDTWSKLDGHIEVNNCTKQKCQCDSINIADQLQHVCFLAGKGSKIVTRKIGDNKQETIYLIPYHRINKQANKREKVYYKGKVWCPTTEDGIVVFRKDGMIFVSGNSPFSNISIYDREFLKEMQEDYIFPDGSMFDMNTVLKLQDLYIDTMNEELERTPITFPVGTVCLAKNKNNVPLDIPFIWHIAKKNLKYGFLNIYTGDSSTISSCCRLRSNKKNEYFNSFGSGSSKIGSMGVCTINYPRLAFRCNFDGGLDFYKELEDLIGICAKVNNAKREHIKVAIKKKKHPLYSYGFMDLQKQYSTCGMNGLNECIEILGKDITKKDGLDLALSIINKVNTVNDYWEKHYNVPHNCEQIPGESTSVKLAEKDKILGFNEDYVLYSNQFIPLTTNADLIDRLLLQGKLDKHFTGGAIAHLNVENRIEKTEDMVNLILYAIELGVVYFSINYNLQLCKNGHMTVGKGNKCTICGADITNNYTRVVGFLTDINLWIKARRKYDEPNRQWYSAITPITHN